MTSIRRRAILVAVAAGVLVGLAGLVGVLALSHEERFEAARERMVARQIEARGITHPAVLAAMRQVPRHRFVPAPLWPLAYEDSPLPIGEGQTISQPYIVALMTELIEPQPDMKVLEIGTGSGYQAAVLAACVKEVDTIEIREDLGRQAETVLKDLGYANVRVRIGDGYAGWPERAPYDAIMLTAAPPRRVPQPLIDQLREGGRIVAPVGEFDQDLLVITKTADGLETKAVAPVRFVPLTGQAEKDR